MAIHVQVRQNPHFSDSQFPYSNLIRLLGEFSEITITIVLGLSITLFSIYLEAELKVSSSSLASESASWVYAKRVCNLSTYLLGVFNFRSHLSRAVYCPLCIWKLCNWRTDADKTLVWWHLIAFSLIDLFLIVLYWVYATHLICDLVCLETEAQIKFTCFISVIHWCGKLVHLLENIYLSFRQSRVRVIIGIKPLQLFKLNPNSLPLRHKVQPLRKSFPLAIDNWNPVPAQTGNKVTP